MPAGGYERPVPANHVRRDFDPQCRAILGRDLNRRRRDSFHFSRQRRCDVRLADRHPVELFQVSGVTIAKSS